MTRRRRDIPRGVSGVPFRAADGELWGVSRSRTRRADAEHPFHGVVGFELDLATVLARCRAFEPMLLDGQAFSHVTALALLEVPLPRRFVEEPLHVSVVFPRTPPRGDGVHGHSLRILETDVVAGLPTAEPAFAWCQSASLLAREDLVAAGDALVTGRRVRGVREPGRTSRARLEEVATQLRGSPGAGKIAWALPRIREGVDSRPETRLRLGCARARLPEPVPDFPIAVAQGIVLHGDLVFPRQKVVLEYEGDVHRVDRETWMRDIERRELLEDAGYRVVRVTAADLFERPDAFFERLRRILAARRT